MHDKYWKLIVEDKTAYFENVLSLIKDIELKQNKEYDELQAKYKAENPQPDESGYSWQDHLGDIGHEYQETVQILHKSFVVSIIMFMESK